LKPSQPVEQQEEVEIERSNSKTSNELTSDSKSKTKEEISDDWDEINEDLLPAVDTKDSTVNKNEKKRDKNEENEDVIN
jgi:hypothetical protein